jgi:hypothetical protein
MRGWRLGWLGVAGTRQDAPSILTRPGYVAAMEGAASQPTSFTRVETRAIGKSDEALDGSPGRISNVLFVGKNPLKGVV